MSAQFYFDVGSPYVYLTVARLPLDDVEWRPISLGGLFKLTGRSSWGLSDAREAGMAEIEARAARYGLPPIRWPDPWPGHYLNAMRACLVGGEAFARVALRMGFVEGRDLSELGAIREAALRSGLDPLDVQGQIGEPAIKQRLIDETAAAHARGVFGVPTLAAGDRLLYGDDQMDGFDPAVRIVGPDPEWPARAAEERRRISDGLGPLAVRVERIGSTAVPGLAAKPILDLLLSVAELEPRERYVEPLEALGYRFVPDPASPDRHFFGRPPERPRSHHLHVCVAGGAEERRHLAVRDFLRAHDHEAAAYASLKRTLATRHAHDRLAYVAGKDAYVADLEARALAWAS